MGSLKKKFFGLYYRRNVSKTITSLVCVIGTTVTKAGAKFNTDGDDDQLFIGMTVVIEGFTYRVASITSDTEFELSAAHDASETVTGVFTTPALANMMGSELITEVDSYWTELPKVEIGASLKVDKNDSIQYSTGQTVVTEEKGLLEFNVLGFQEYSSTPEIEGRLDELRTAINQENVDILLFNYSNNKPNAVAYYDVFGSVSVALEAGGLPKIVIVLDENESQFDENNVFVFKFIIETPVCDPDVGASSIAVTIHCNTVGAKMYMTITGVDPTESDTLVENYEVYTVAAALTLKVKAFKDNMTASAVGSGTYT